MNLPKRVALAPDVLYQPLPGEAILLHLGSEQYYGLDRTGARIWELLAQDGDVPAAVAQMTREFDVSPAVIQTDMARLINELAAAQLLTVF